MRTVTKNIVYIHLLALEEGLYSYLSLYRKHIPRHEKSEQRH